VVIRFAEKRGLNTASGENVWQETMVALVRLLPGFTYDPKKRFRNLVFTIAVRAIWAEQRRIKRRREVPLEPGGREDEPNLGDSLMDETVLAPVEKMEADWRESLFEEAWRRLSLDATCQGRTMEIFRAYVLAGDPVEAVARRFGLKANAVYQIKNRLLKRLRQEIEQMRRDLGELGPGPVSS